MEKCFALKSFIPEMMGNGRIAVYSTTDRRISHLVIIDSSFQWPNRNKQEAFRCGRCKAFILPDEKSKTKDGIKFHKICNPKKIKGSPRPALEATSEGREPGEEKGIVNEVDNARTGVDDSLKLE